MIIIDVTTDDKMGIAGYLSGLRAQLPYATAVAINDTVNQVQSAVQLSLDSDFTLRQPGFIKNTVYRKPGQDFATKTNLVGATRINPERDFLAKFEDDSVKSARGSNLLNVPILRLSAPAIIVKRGDPLDARRILSLIQSQGGKNVGPFRKRGARKASQESFFLVHTKNGRTLILQRVGSQIRTLYSLVQQVPITSHRLHFDEIAEPVALARWEPNFERALDVAIASMWR